MTQSVGAAGNAERGAEAVDARLCVVELITTRFEGKPLDFGILHLGLAEPNYINIQGSDSSIVNAGSWSQYSPSLMECGIGGYWQLSFL